MQATVRRFDPVSCEGSVLLDDGSEVPYGRAAFAAGGLRLLRVGQRVRLDLDPDGAVVLITISTL